MVSDEEIVEEIARRSKQSKSATRLILKEYVKIVTRELLRGNKIEFPCNFGYAEIISMKMSAFKIKSLQNRGKEVYDLFRNTKIAFYIPFRIDYDLQVYAVGLWIDRFKYILKNQIRKYRYVD